MDDLKIGQVLWLKLKFDTESEISSIAHPYLIVKIENEFLRLRLLQFDSLEGREYRAFQRANMIVTAKEPTETVIVKDSFIKLDSIIDVEIFEELKLFKRTDELLSRQKLEKVIWKYEQYLREYDIPDTRIQFFTKEDVLSFNQ